MRRIVSLLAVFAATGTAVSVAAAASNPQLPPAGHYKTTGGGFTINAKRTTVSNLKLSVNVGNDDTSDCSPGDLPAGVITLKVKKALKLTAAHRGGYTTYIVGKSTPKTSNGITAIPETFQLSTGGTVQGTLYLAFTQVKSGDGEVTIGSCLVDPGFSKG